MNTENVKEQMNERARAHKHNRIWKSEEMMHNGWTVVRSQNIKSLANKWNAY